MVHRQIFSYLVVYQLSAENSLVYWQCVKYQTKHFEVFWFPPQTKLKIYNSDFVSKLPKKLKNPLNNSESQISIKEFQIFSKSLTFKYCTRIQRDF